MQLTLNSAEISSNDELFKKQRVIRVFISSTFKDMEEEREELIKYIFPKLQKLCDERGVIWSEVDLRWGVTDEQKSDGQVLPLCLAEIDNCTPFFIGILGERYGWIPEISENLLEQYTWLENYQGSSVTEIEILHGVLLKKKKPVYGFFYFRDPKFIENLDDEQKEIYLDSLYPSEVEGLHEFEIREKLDNRLNKLNHLKDRIRNSGYHLRENFLNVKDLGTMVYEDFSQLIDELFPKDELEDELQIKSHEHRVFAMMRSKYFVGREKYLKEITEYVTRGGKPLVITGESGAGKSSLLAYWALNYIDRKNNDKAGEKLPLLMHFIGGTPSSGDRVSLMRRITMELIRIFDLNLTLPNDSNKLREAFALALDMVSEKGKINGEGSIIIILDAINQLNNLVDIQDLLWLPTTIPPNIRLIISTTKGPELSEFEKREWTIWELELLSDEECKETIYKYLSAFGKTLDPIYIDKILENPMSKNPLFLRTILEEIRIYGSSDDLNNKIEHYVSSTSVQDLFIKKIQRLEEDYDRERENLVQDALTFLWASRTGLMESELLNLLGTREKRLSSSIWSPLYLAIESNLLNHSGYIRLFHDYFRSAIESYYLDSDEKKRKIYNKLANYYSQDDISLTRVLQELPWQLTKAKEWYNLYNLLKDMNFISKLWEYDPFDVKSYWVTIEENTKSWKKNTEEELTMLKAYDSMIHHPENFDTKELQLVAMLMEDIYLDEALQLNYYINNYYEKTNQFDSLIKSSSHISRILISKGNYQKAMDILKHQEQLARANNLWEVIQESLGNQAETLLKWGEHDEAMKLLKQQEEICRELSDKMGLQKSLGNQAKILRLEWDFDKAHERLEEMERINIQLSNKDGLQKVFGLRALILRNQNKIKDALNLLQLQENMCRSIGNFEDLQECLGYQVECIFELGNRREANLILKEQEAICIHIKHKDGLQRNYAMYAKMYSNSKMKKYDMALKFLEKQERICRDLENKADLQECIGRQAYINIKMNKIDKAIELIQEQETICREQNYQVGLHVALGFKSMIYQNEGKIFTALEMTLEQDEISRKIGDNRRVIISLKTKASFMNRLGEIEKAYHIYQEIEAICNELDDQKGLTNALYGQASYFAMKGDYARALTLYKNARDIATLTNNKQDLIRIQLSIEKMENVEDKHGLSDENDLITNFQVIPPTLITIMEMIHANQGLSFAEIKSLLMEKEEYQDLQDNDLTRIIFQLRYRDLIYSVKKFFNGRKRTTYYLSDLGEFKLRPLAGSISTITQPSCSGIPSTNKENQESVESESMVERFVKVLKEELVDYQVLYTDKEVPIVKVNENPVKYIVVYDHDNSVSLSSQLEFIHATTKVIYLVSKTEQLLYMSLMPKYYKWVKDKYEKIQNMDKDITIFITFIEKYEEEKKWRRVSW